MSEQLEKYSAIFDEAEDIIRVRIFANFGEYEDIMNFRDETDQELKEFIIDCWREPVVPVTYLLKDDVKVREFLQRKNIKVHKFGEAEPELPAEKCPKCGALMENVSRAQRKFVCPECFFEKIV